MQGAGRFVIVGEGLTNGAVVIVHPNTYHPEVGYMVFGDTVVVTDTGFERLIKTPRELLSVPVR